MPGLRAAQATPGSLNVIGGQYAAIKTQGKIIDEMVLDPLFCHEMRPGENPKGI